MKIGQLTESVMKRSVLREIQYHRNEVLSGATLGDNCAILSLDEDEILVTESITVAAPVTDAGGYAIQRVANEIAVRGAQPVAVNLSGSMFPENYEEEQLHQWMKQAEAIAAKLQIQIVGANGTVTKAVNQPVIHITGIGKAAKNCYLLISGAVAGQDVVVTKWIGLEGTAIIAHLKEDELRTRFSTDYIEEAKGLKQWLSVLPEAALAGKSDAGDISLIAEGGVFGALWNMAERSGVGLKVELKKIPIRQETVEICNYYDVNPYELLSSGSLLITTENGGDLVKRLSAEGIEAVVIGKTTADNDRLIVNEEEKRFLTPPQPDALYKVIDNHN